MRKGTKKIRKVATGSGTYYVYDLDEDIFGKRKRLYGKTEGELKEKIEQAEKEKAALVSSFKPSTKLLSDYVTYYFRNAVGKVASSTIKKQMSLFKNAVFESQIDKDIDAISKDEIQEFYNYLIGKFPSDSVVEIDAVLQKTFELSNAEGLTSMDFKGITIPEKQAVIVGYILSPEEFENMLSYCIEDDCTHYGKNEQIVILCMLTGLKLTSLKRLRCKDVDLENGVLYCDNRTVELSDRTISWLKKQAVEQQLPLAVSGVASGSEDDLLFLNSNNVSPALQSIQSTITFITKRCGLPKGITGKTLCKAYVVSELEKGTSAEELCRRLGYKNQRTISEIKDEYEIKRLLF